MRKWFKNFIARLDMVTVSIIRSAVVEEKYSAIVHQGQLYLAKGATIFFCGSCEKIIADVFARPTPPQSGKGDSNASNS